MKLKHKELELLKNELLLIQDNIKRLEAFIEKDKKNKWTSYSSHVFGELKHRLTAFKQRATIINKMSTYDFTKK